MCTASYCGLVRLLTVHEFFSTTIFQYIIKCTQVTIHDVYSVILWSGSFADGTRILFDDNISVHKKCTLVTIHDVYSVILWSGSFADGT